MISLLKLELKKFKLFKYGINFIFITLCILGLTTLCGLPSEDGFISNRELFDFGDVIIRITFTIFSAVLLSRLIISEFRNSTIKIMFTYPISRKKIIGAKLIIVWIFTFVTILLESILFGVGVMFINRFIPIAPETLMLSDLTGRYQTILYSAIVTSGMSLISLFFGMMKKSTSTTIVAAVIISLLINSSVGNQGMNLFSQTVVPVLLCLIGVIIAVFSYYNIDKIDIN